MEKKQTALEFFAEQDLIYTNLFIEGKITKAVFLFEKDKLYAACKQMEKEQVLNFEGLLYQHEVDAFANHTIILTAEEFYDKLYGGEDE
jgi:hypothetical protein